MKMFCDLLSWGLARCSRRNELRPARRSAVRYGMLLAPSASAILLCSPGFFFSAGLFSFNVRAQQADGTKPVVVQPGAPGEPSKTLPPTTKGTLPPRSQADVEFMQGMIMHHAQAVEMTALIASHTENKDLRLLGARISSSQSGEIRFMKRWLAARGESLSMAMPEMPNMDTSHQTIALMPVMLTPDQMEPLRNAK